MKIRLQVLAAAALLSVMGLRAGAADSSFRVLWRGTGGWGDKSAYCALFDTKTIETVKGVVVSVDAVSPMPQMSPGIELQLKTDKAMMPIHLGPLWYLENQDIDIKSNDTVEVTGSKIFCNGQYIISATEVRHGDKTIKLRDAGGRPLWVATAP